MQNDQGTNKVRIEEGILYVEFTKLDADSIIEAEENCVTLIKENKITLIPAIVIMKGEASQKLDVEITKFGKILSSVDVIKYLSEILIVGASEGAKKPLLLVSKIFLNSSLTFCDTLEEAKEKAHKAKFSTLSILSKENKQDEQN